MLTVPPITLAPRSLVDRHRLAGDHRFVDRRRGLRSPSPSTGTFSPGRTRSRSPTAICVERHLLVRAVGARAAAPSSAPGRAAPGWRRAVCVAGAQLQHLAQQHQHGDDRRRLEIDRHRAVGAAERRREQAGRERRHDAVEPGDAGAQAIRVNMLRCACASDCQPRTKNGQPAHSTTGVASTNCSQFDVMPCEQHAQRWRQMPAHLERQDRHGQHQRRSRTGASCRRVPDSGRSSRLAVGGLQRHAADRAAARPDLADLGMHGAGVDRARLGGRGGGWRCGGGLQVAQRLGGELAGQRGLQK